MGLRHVFEGKVDKTPPLWLMRQAGRYLPEYRALRAKVPDFITFISDAPLAIEVTLQPLRRYALDAAIIFSDILMVPHALGQKVEFLKGEGPHLQALRTAQDLQRLTFDQFDHRIHPTLSALKGVRAALTPSQDLIGFAGAPWTVTAYMLEGKGSKAFDVAKTWMVTFPQEAAQLLALLEEATIRYLRAQVEAGAQVLQLFESWAGVVPFTHREAWIYGPTRRIVQALKASHPHVPIMGFPRLMGPALEDFVRLTGVDGVSFDYTYDPAWVASHVSCVAQGGVDPALLVVGGASLREAIQTSKKAFQGRPYIFNLGHGVLQTTPPDHVAALVDFVKEAA